MHFSRLSPSCVFRFLPSPSPCFRFPRVALRDQRVIISPFVPSRAAAGNVSRVSPSRSHTVKRGNFGCLPSSRCLPLSPSLERRSLLLPNFPTSHLLGTAPRVVLRQRPDTSAVCPARGLITRPCYATASANRTRDSLSSRRSANYTNGRANEH